jgi:hypothetical protein
MPMPKILDRLLSRSASLCSIFFVFAMILCFQKNDAAMDGRSFPLQKNILLLMNHGLLRNNDRLIECRGLNGKPESYLHTTFAARLNLRGGDEDEDQDPFTGLNFVGFTAYGSINLILSVSSSEAQKASSPRMAAAIQKMEELRAVV